MTITIYGIKSCSTMKKAFAKLDELSVDYSFHDYKKQGVNKIDVQHWVDALGVDKVLNKRGMTWRKLTDEQKQAADATVEDAIDLLVVNTSMIKRPIVEGQFAGRSVLLCGFDEEAFDSAFHQN
ncbi:Spx/MgsR family RNA polymerase-binding regulatory protein [Psychrobacter sp. DM4]|uniref:Spx/MgsR family RNA polymerase-binding regulatory protein n=1 Tax=Psychrobacter sp. DM4 TaxID=3440637 RepID=UPI003F4FC62F